MMRRLFEKWRVYRERKKRLDAARNANPDSGRWDARRRLSALHARARRRPNPSEPTRSGAFTSKQSKSQPDSRQPRPLIPPRGLTQGSSRAARCRAPNQAQR
jgi:hypothetical protein